MKRTLVALTAFSCLAVPAFADPCDAATEVAARAALDDAAAANRRTAIVRVQCGGERQTFVLQRTGGKKSSTITVREIKSGELAGGAVNARSKSAFTGSSSSRVIRVND